MKLDTREVALQLVRHGKWEEAYVREGERPRQVLLVDDIQAGRHELVREMRKLLPSVTLSENSSRNGDGMVEVDTEELNLRRKLFLDAEYKSAEAGTIRHLRSGPESRTR